ncbi:MAG: hypothetical protein JWP48_901 [Actinoallomurus sp.]|jgi:hypothetical protein|nr:hypothetical protein [Actinoallomurus sp.]
MAGGTDILATELAGPRTGIPPRIAHVVHQAAPAKHISLYFPQPRKPTPVTGGGRTRADGSAAQAVMIVTIVADHVMTRSDQ